MTINFTDLTTKSSTGFSSLFKVKYEAFSSALWMSGAAHGDAFLSQVKKVFKNQGKQIEFPVQTTYGGSVSVGELGMSSSAQAVTVTVPAMSLYARMRLDRKTIKQSRGDGAAFVDSLQYEVENKVRATARAEALLGYNADTAILGQFGAAATGTAAAPVITILNTGTYQFRQHFFEEDEIVEIEKDVTGTPALQASYFKITAVNPSARTVTLSRLTGSVDLTNAGYNSQTHNVIIQKGSTLNDHQNYPLTNRRAPMGILGVLALGIAGSGSRYGVSYQRRFAPLVTNASSAILTPDVLIDGAFDYESTRGEFPTMLVASYRQFQSALKLAEGNSLYKTASLESVGPVKFSFPGVQIMTPKGNIMMVSSRFLRDDVVFYTTPEKHTAYYAGPFGWFDDDGTMLLRLTDDDSYEARYGGYYENFFHPFYFNFVYGLSVA